MSKLVKSLKQFMNNEEGMAAVEYALVVAIMAVAIVAAWGTLRNGLQGAFDSVVTLLQSGGASSN